MNNDKEDCPISLNGTTNFVVGLPHSGTTILYRLLGRHPDLGWFSQFSQRSGTVSGRFPLPGWQLYNRVARGLFATPWKKGTGLFHEWFVPMPREAIQTWDYLLSRRGSFTQHPPSAWTRSCVDEDTVERFRAVFKAEFDAWKTDKLLFKLPRLIQAIPALEAVLPNSRFVHIVRDGRAVAASIRFKFKTESRSSREALLAAGEFWQDVLNNFTETVEDEDPTITTIHQEKFLGNPSEKFKDILRFLDLDVDRYPWPLPELRSDPNQKWKDRLTEQEIHELNDLLQDELQKWDYSEDWLAD